MATAYIYNGFGSYETNDKGEKGITLTYSGENFWLPFQQVTPIPNFNFRELDHDKSTPQGDQVGSLVYMNTRVTGDKLADELVNSQVPYSMSYRGVMQIVGKRTKETVLVFEGRDAETGEKLITEVPEVVATPEEKLVAETNALEYKKRVIADFFQSKRERMTGGQGRLHPDRQTRLYMDELNVQDLDDVTTHAKDNVLEQLVGALKGLKATEA